MSLRDQLKEYAEEPLTQQLMMNLLKDYKRPYDKIHELVKTGKLVSVKKGLYIPGPKSNIQKPASFLLANHLWGQVMCRQKQRFPGGNLSRNGYMKPLP